MADVAKVVADYSDFVGMHSNMDRHDLPPGGSQFQSNVSAVEPGQLVVRGGLQTVLFDQE